MQTQLSKNAAQMQAGPQRSALPTMRAATTTRVAAGRAPASAFVQIASSASPAARANSRSAVLASALASGATAAPVEKTSSPLNIVFVSAEVSPWSKVRGGVCVVCLPLLRPRARPWCHPLFFLAAALPHSSSIACALTSFHSLPTHKHSPDRRPRRRRRWPADRARQARPQRAVHRPSVRLESWRD